MRAGNGIAVNAEKTDCRGTPSTPIATGKPATLPAMKRGGTDGPFSIGPTVGMSRDHSANFKMEMNTQQTPAEPVTAMVVGSGPWFGDWGEALCAAHRLAKQTARGIAYAIRWPAGHCTVEEKTPLIKDRSTRVVLVTASGEEQLA